jgi:hypothetical protein
VIIISERTLDRFRLGGYCGFCRRYTFIEPHHIVSRGIGGSHRIDLPINIVGLCVTCHRMHHDGRRPLKCDLLAIVAGREGIFQNEIEATLNRLRWRVGKLVEPSDEEIQELLTC